MGVGEKGYGSRGREIGGTGVREKGIRGLRSKPPECSVHLYFVIISIVIVICILLFAGQTPWNEVP